MNVVPGVPSLRVCSLLCAGCTLGEGRVAPIYAKRSVVVLSTVKHNGFGTFYIKDRSGALGAYWRLLGSPGCLLGASWVPTGCFLGGWVRPGCLLGIS